ncbi:unnamed protein product [Linum trigynum]|uniref:Uncharacterized protein n=1 Tax=Linum trigynum TaxID=586398 RepID=A0AAV2DB48_9ROSI
MHHQSAIYCKLENTTTKGRRRIVSLFRSHTADLFSPTKKLSAICASCMHTTAIPSGNTEVVVRLANGDLVKVSEG